MDYWRTTALRLGLKNATTVNYLIWTLSVSGHGDRWPMKIKTSKRKHSSPKRVLRLPDLDFAKTAVLNTLSSSESRRSYRFAIDDFVTWYCSEPRLAFSKTVVLRYRLELEGRHLAPSTINLRLAAVRRLAYEAADTGLLSPGALLQTQYTCTGPKWEFRIQACWDFAFAIFRRCGECDARRPCGYLYPH